MTDDLLELAIATSGGRELWKTLRGLRIDISIGGPITQQHIATMARLHRDDRYNRLTHDVEDLTGRPAQSVLECISQRRELFT